MLKRRSISSIKLLAIYLMVFSSCASLKQTTKSEFGDEFYVMKKDETKSRVYVNFQNEVLQVYKAVSEGKLNVVDTLQPPDSYSPLLNSGLTEKITFSRNSPDLDFFTIPLKYRFAKKGVPHQLNTAINGTVYFGHRMDFFTLKYRPNALNRSPRRIKHFGFSYGVFTGLGNTFLSPTTTNNNIQEEYNGVILNKGIAAIIAIDNLTVGLTLGYDNLLDKNSKIWIYENQPSLGIALGLNLN